MENDIRGDIMSFVSSQSVENRIQGEELQFKVCPECENPNWNFEINLESGAYSCWSCKDDGGLGKGHFYELRKRMTGEEMPGRNKDSKVKPVYIKADRLESPERDLIANKFGGRDYLKERGITPETQKHFHLGVTEKHGKPCLVMPYMSAKYDRVKLIKYRTLPPAPKQFFREKGMPSVLFNYDFIESDTLKEEVIICGAEIDAMSVWQSGMKNVVAASVGESSKGKSFPDEWVEALSKYEKVIMLYDGDEKGRQSAIEMRRRIGEDKIYIVELPEGQDANGILVKSGPEALLTFIEDAAPSPIDGIESAVDVVDIIMTDLAMGVEVDFGYNWVFPKMTESFGKKSPGNLIVIGGAPQAGKSTLAMDDFLWSTSPDNPDQAPALYSCFEMSRKKVTRKMVQSLMGVTKEEITMGTMIEARKLIKERPIYLEYHDQGDVNIDFVLQNMEKAYKRFGTKYIVVDNLHILARANAKTDKEELMEQGRITRALKVWAEARDAIVVLILHLRKQEEGSFGGMNAWRGSAAISADVDIGFTVTREYIGPKNMKEVKTAEMSAQYSPNTVLTLDKVRDHDDSFGRVWLVLEGQYSRFREATGHDFTTS